MNPDDKLFPEAWDPITDYYRDPAGFLERWEGVAPVVPGYTFIYGKGYQHSGYMYDTVDRPTNMTYDPYGIKIQPYEP